MKQANLAFLLALGVVVIIFKIATRNTAASDQSATGGAPVVPLDAALNVPITEAAYHQGASAFAAATGPDEGMSGEEVTTTQ